MDTKNKKQKRERRQKRIRAKVFGTSERPRLSVFKSNRYIAAQIIDDSKGVTLASETSKSMKEKTALLRSRATGESLAKKAKEKGIIKVVFDRGGFIYTGSVAALAEGAREGGLEF